MRVVCMCVSGPERTLSHTLPLMKSMRASLDAQADLRSIMFLAGFGTFQDDLWNDRVWDDKRTTYAQTRLELASPGRLSYARTLQQCHTMIETYEIRHGLRFAYVLRLRTDGLYNFRWTHTSDWSYRPNLIFTTHCMRSHHDFSNPNHFHCSRSSSECLSDQFAVMSRDVASHYFNGFHDTMRTDSKALVQPQECLLAKKLRNVTWRSLCVSDQVDMTDPTLKINWGPLRSVRQQVPGRTYYMTFPQSC